MYSIAEKRNEALEAIIDIDIGQWVLMQSCRQHHEWVRKGFESLKTTLNLSAKQFQQPNFVTRVINTLKKSDMDPKYLGFELTESSTMINPILTIKIMKKLKQFGLSFNLDDFGTGFSSLSYIKQFSLDEIKIDMSFIKDLTTDPDDTSKCNINNYFESWLRFKGYC
jgi:EAL domain-containing protein (putative c-di-GMP-specific phosphodiesterase class I)